jgi:hypothetical protein
MRAASRDGASIAITANGVPQPSCTLPAGAWADCRINIGAGALRSGINDLSMTSDTISPSADRPGDPRELAFVMQASRVRIGQ